MMFSKCSFSIDFVFKYLVGVGLEPITTKILKQFELFYGFLSAEGHCNVLANIRNMKSHKFNHLQCI